MDRKARADFNLRCIANKTSGDADSRRIPWNAAVVTESGPALLHRHPDYEEAFAEWMTKD